ncbi:MAG: trans-aconitate 2-methyltransferase [Actinomycetes bacterium]
MHEWDPGVYLQFADQRARPFFDLTARIPARSPTRVVDLGCGPGQLTAALADRWPAADVVGVDASAAMVEQARTRERPNLRFRVGDLRTWTPAEPVDVLVSNATLQWVPDHRALLPRLLAAVRPGGWLAFAVPGNYTEPSHQILRELAGAPRFASATTAVPFPSSHDPAVYLTDLAALGCEVDAWETTYLHVLTGPDPVFRWVAGTGARPVLQALDDAQRADFADEYRQRLRQAYPPASGHGEDVRTVLPFRRVFVVAQRPAPETTS